LPKGARKNAAEATTRGAQHGFLGSPPGENFRGGKHRVGKGGKNPPGFREGGVKKIVVWGQTRGKLCGGKNLSAGKGGKPNLVGGAPLYFWERNPIYVTEAGKKWLYKREVSL